MKKRLQAQKEIQNDAENKLQPEMPDSLKPEKKETSEQPEYTDSLSIELKLNSKKTPITHKKPEKKVTFA